MSSMDDLILSAFLRESVFYAQYSSIVEDDMFSSSSHKICINVYLEYTRKYSKMPTQEEMYADLTKYCQRYGIDDSIKQLAIETLIKCYKLTYNIDYVKDNFVKFATVNKTTVAVIEAAKLIKKKGDDLSDSDYEKIQDMIEKAITIKARDTEGVIFSEVADDPLKFIQTQNRYDKSLIVKTGIPSVDNAHIAGGPLPGEMYVISAPPGRGKSTLLVNIGANALLQGKDVIHIFVGDNTEADGVIRYCARLTGVPMSQIMMNSAQYLSSWNHLKENFDLGNLIIGAYPIDGPSMADIRSFITKNMIRAGVKPTVLILDYIDNCRRNESMNSYDALGALYTQMKNICEEMKLVGWTASQPKQEYWDSDGHAGLSSLAESSKKQHILDGMFTLKKFNDASYQLYVPKFRRGRSDFSVDLMVDYDRMFVRESIVSRVPQATQTTQSTLVTPENYHSEAPTGTPPSSQFGGSQ